MKIRPTWEPDFPSHLPYFGTYFTKFSLVTHSGTHRTHPRGRKARGRRDIGKHTAKIPYLSIGDVDPQIYITEASTPYFPYEAVFPSHYELSAAYYSRRHFEYEKESNHKARELNNSVVSHWEHQLLSRPR